MTTASPRRGGSGCLGYGCLIAVVLFVLVVGGLLFGARWSLRSATQLFTTEQPVPVAPLSVDGGTLAASVERARAIGQLLADPKGAGDFSLSETDLNALMSATTFKDSARVELKGDAILSTFSIPLRALGQWQAASVIIGDMLDRYLSGSATLKLEVNNGVASATLENLTLNGQVFDGDSLKEASEYVSGYLNNSSGDEGGDRGILQRLGSVRVEGGQLLLKIRPQ